jgi:hypothetical protein
LIPLLWSGEKPDQIPFDLLPTAFVIKATHGCGYNRLVQNKMEIDYEEVRLILEKWLSKNYCQDNLIGIEWGYKNIKPHIIIESFIEENGKYPVDYKFWCFSGRTEVITVHIDRFEKHVVRTLNRNFEPYNFLFPLDNGSGEYQRPTCFKEMVEFAESLAENFDFMRVDLYNSGNRIYFSELTPYPGGVTAKFEPDDLDLALGEKWKCK